MNDHLGGDLTNKKRILRPIAFPAIHRTGLGHYNGGTGQGNKNTVYCTYFERNNHSADRCYAKQHGHKQNSNKHQGGFSGFALTATSNGSMNIVIDCGCTNQYIPDKSRFKTSPSTIVIKLTTSLISSALCSCRGSNFI